MRRIVMVFAFVVVLVGVLLGNNPLALGQETQAAPPSVPPLSPLSIQAPFKEREFAPYEKTKKGTASISGQGFLVTRGKEVIYQPGDEVALVPETAYTREWFDKYVQRQGSCSFGISEDDKLSKDQKECGLPQYILRMVLGDKRLSPYVRFTRANPTGHFWFNKVPPGRYFIVTRITWEIAASGQFAGGLAWAFVEVGPGEQLINIVVTD